MRQLYGTAFLSMYGDNPAPLWESAIAELSDDQCRKGLTVLAGQPREYPANLTQFVDACKPKTAGSPRFLGVPMTSAQLAGLLPKPEQQATPEKVDSWIAKMRSRVANARP